MKGVVAPDPVAGLSARELKKLRSLTGSALRLQHRLRLFALKLPPAADEAVREIVRSRIECVVNDYLSLAVRSLDAAIAEADPDAVS
jgi:hypothetical protein